MDTKKYPQRKSPRLQGYDYSQSGGYFVTICTYQRNYLFGDVIEQKMRLNAWGAVAVDCWEAIPKHFSGVTLDLFIVMPNHVHGILFIQNTGGASLSTIVGNYKAAVTRQINLQPRKIEREPIWQRSFHDHIIRDDEMLGRLQDYVLHNPSHWQEDQFNTSLQK